MSKHVILHRIEQSMQVIKSLKHFVTLKSKLRRRSDVSKHPTLNSTSCKAHRASSCSILQQNLPGFKNLTLHLML